MQQIVSCRSAGRGNLLPLRLAWYGSPDQVDPDLSCLFEIVEQEHFALAARGKLASTPVVASGCLPPTSSSIPVVNSLPQLEALLLPSAKMIAEQHLRIDAQNVQIANPPGW